MRKKPTDLAPALEVYEDALIRGLCPQGALEVARDSLPAGQAATTLQDLDNAMKASDRTDTIRIKRIYDPPSRSDGVRVLVDRLWPRGIAKTAAKLDGWFKELAPTDKLRKWFAHDPVRWQEFERKYDRELRDLDDQIEALRELAGNKTVTLLYAAKDEEHNNAVVLRDYLRHHKPKRKKSRA